MANRKGKLPPWLEEWFIRIGRGAADGALDNDGARKGVSHMVADLFKQYKGWIIGAGVLIGTLITVTFFGLIKSNRRNYRR
jgi:hypothetical protein